MAMVLAATACGTVGERRWAGRSNGTAGSRWTSGSKWAARRKWAAGHVTARQSGCQVQTCTQRASPPSLMAHFTSAASEWAWCIESTPGSAVPTVFVGAAAGLKNVNGLMVDNEKAGLLYLCANDFFGGGAATVRTYGLSDGSAKQTYTFTGPVACNDLVQDGSGNVYMADSIGKVHRLSMGGAAFAAAGQATQHCPQQRRWALEPTASSGIGQSSMYVNNFEKGTLRGFLSMQMVLLAPSSSLR